MQEKRVTTIATLGVLGLTGLASFMLPSTLTVPSGLAAGADNDIVLNGLLRDFSKTHPDFDVTPGAGYGHYAGSVQTFLPGSRRPAFVVGGYQVLDQWLDDDSRPIAPHMAGIRGGLVRETLGVRINGSVEVKKETVIDAFNSNFGPYGVMGNYGSDARLSTNSTAPDAVKVEQQAYIRGDVYVGPGGNPADVIENKGLITGTLGVLAEAQPMPEVTLPDDPADLEPYVPVLDLSGNVTLTGDTNPDDDSDAPAMHVGDLTMRPDAVVTIEGDLRIRCDRSLEIEKAELVLLPEASVTFYVSDIGGGTGDIRIHNESLVNVDRGDTTLVVINAIGAGKLEIDKKTHVYASIMASARELSIKDGAHFYGGFVGEALKIDGKKSSMHVDLGNAALGVANFALSVREKVELDDNAQIDSFDSNDGPYGGMNVGTNAWVSTNATKDNEKIHLKSNSTINGDVMIGPFGDLDKVVKVEGGSVINGDVGQIASPYPIPVVTPPSLGARVDEVKYDDGLEHTLAADLYCKKLKIEVGSILNIDGDVTIRVDDEMTMKDFSEIRLNPGATLTLYANKKIKLENGCLINANTGNPQLVSIRMMSLGKKGKIEVFKNSQIVAWTQGVRSELVVEDGSTYSGSFTGRKAKIKKNSRMHVDMAYLTNCITVLDTAGMEGVADDGGVTSAATFDEWFRTVLGTNQAMGHSITLTRDGAGIYNYVNNGFYPLDDRLLGNDGDAHNYHFTYTIGATFVYRECWQQFVEFKGGDGAWLFVNGQLVMDLGGMRSVDEQYVELDRLGLEDGETYKLYLFYAQRQSTESVFQLRTNIPLDSDNSIPSVLAMYD